MKNNPIKANVHKIPVLDAVNNKFAPNKIKIIPNKTFIIFLFVLMNNIILEIIEKYKNIAN